MLQIDTNIFRDNLLLTKAFCNKQLDIPTKAIASILRTINPEYNGKPLFQFNIKNYGVEPHSYTLTDWSLDLFTKENDHLLKDLFEIQLKQKGKISELPRLESSLKGDIIFTEIDNTVTDGASAVTSKGLFDDYDIPPIDTWLYMAQSSNGLLLFGWIPEKFIQLAQDAIAVNCVECIHWFKDEYPFEYISVMGRNEMNR